MDAPSGTISPAQPSGENPSAKIKMPKRMYKGPPFLKSFTLFPKLPLEIRMMIWMLTLQPRDIELHFNYIRGFFTRVCGPVTLRVNQESRSTVKPFYPLCFGNAVYQPRVLFNFSIDTLLLEHNFQPQVLLFLAGLKPDELAQLRYLAVDASIDEDYGDGDHMDIDAENLIRKVVPAMTALEEIRLIFSLEYIPETDMELPYASGPMKLYDETWPLFLQDYHADYHLAIWECDSLCSVSEFDAEIDSLCDCDCMELPTVENNWAQLEGPTVSTAWGWRPVFGVPHE